MMKDSTQKMLLKAYDNVVNVPEAFNAVQESFFYGFAWNVLLSAGSPMAGLAGGAVSSTASMIDAILRPKLKDAFGEDSLSSSLIRNAVVLSVTSLITAPPFFGLSVSFSIVYALLLRAIYALLVGESMGRLQVIPIRP
jgi:hypothetical protein